VATGLNKITPIRFAINNKNVDIVKALIGAKVNINNIENDHNSPLGGAVDNESLEIVKLLIISGADVNPKDGKSFLEMAISKENLDIVKTLIDAGADINPKNDNNPLGLAINKKNSQLVKLLIEAGADKKMGAEGSKWSTIKILNEWKEVIGLGAVSETISSSDRLSFPYCDLKATLVFDGENACIRFNSDPNLINGEMQSSGRVLHNLKIRVDNKNYTWDGYELPGTNDIVFYGRTACRAWATGKEFSVSLPLYQGGVAIFCWNLNGASDAIASTFSK